MFLYFRYCFYVSLLLRKRKWYKLEFPQKTVLITIVISIPNKGETDIFLFSHFFFGAWEKFYEGFPVVMKIFEAPQKSVKTNFVIFYFNYFRMLRAGRVNKVFSPGTFISKKMVTNMKLAFINIPFRHNLAFKNYRVVTCILHFVCFYGWSSLNMSVSGDHM